MLPLIETLEALLGVGVAATEDRRLTFRLRFPCLPAPWRLAVFDFFAQPGIDEPLIPGLATGPPVHVVPFQARHFDRAQAEPGNKCEDREVPNAQRSAAIAPVEQSLDVRGTGAGGGSVAKRHPPTGSTAVPSRNGVMPCKYRSRRTERSSATRSLAGPADTRAHSRSRNAMTSTPVIAAGAKRPSPIACSCRKRRAVFS